MSRIQALDTKPLVKKGLIGVVDFGVNWMGILASITVSANIPLQLSLSYIALATIAIVDLKYGTKRLKPARATKSDQRTEGQKEIEKEAINAYLPRKRYLTAYRATMMILTCVSILAVDFNVFPRRFAKVETWGTSLMDLGVGSFVFSMGLVSARGVLSDVYLGRQTPFTAALFRSVKQSLSVLILGVIRLASVKVLSYQEHVTEYGVHWNFFMTLGLLPPFVTVLSFSPRRVPTALVALLIAGIYEISLDKWGLTKWILSAPRDNLIASNKEGLCSFIGYLSIFLSGLAIGYFVLPARIRAFSPSVLFPQTRAEAAHSRASNKWTACQLLVVSCLFYSILLWATLASLTPSRRIANLPYILWTCAFNCGALAAYATLEAVGLPVAVPPSFDAVNINGLAIFLIANVSTGLVNMSIKTIDASRLLSMEVLASYALFLFAVSLLLYRYGIRIKI
jgi:phosphatidylinositol glycan class W